MNHYKRYFNLIFIVFSLIFYLILELPSGIWSDVAIESYDADITLNDQGDMTVVERWVMDYNQEMRVRFRDIKYNKYAENYPLVSDDDNHAMIDSSSIDVEFYKGFINKTSDIRIGLASQGDYDELNQQITCPDYALECESIFVDTYYAGGLDGEVTFIYTYVIEGVVTKYSDISELNWRLFEYAEGTIKDASITINMPNNDYDVSRFYVWGHGLSSGNIEVIDNQTIEVTMENIKNGEFPELRVLMPNLLFPNIRPNNIVIHPDMDFDRLYDYENQLAIATNRRIFIAQIIFYGAFILIPLMGFITYKVYLNHDKEYEPEFQGDFYRELPNEATPAEVSYLYYMKKIKDEVFTATLLDLIRRKYISIVGENENMTALNANFILQRININEEQDLLSHEKVFMDMIFNMIGNKTKVSTKQIEVYASSYTDAKAFENKTTQFVKEAKRQSEKNKYFESLRQEKSNSRKFVLIPVVYLGISIFLWMFLAIDTFGAMGISLVIIVSYLIYIAQFKRRSKTGNELFVKWKAFRNFLVNFSSMKDYPIPAIIVWEHYLVYATVFQLADIVMEQLSVKLPKEVFEEEQSTYLRYGYSRYPGSRVFFFHQSFGNSFSQAKNNAAQTIARHNQSQSSSGRGGGFGGGSSFGGGGGGGRSR